MAVRTCFGRADSGFVSTNPPYGFAGSPSVVVKLDPSGNTVGSTLLYAAISTLTMDGSKNVYLAGLCDGSTFPTTPGAFQTGLPGRSGFVAKLNASGRVEWATELGGQDGDSSVSAIAVDAGGVYVDGTTRARSFPTTPGAFQQTVKASASAQQISAGFIAKLNPAGSGLVFSTFLGGTANGGAGTFLNGMAIDTSGAVYAIGGSFDSDFSVTPGAYKTRGHMVLTKLAAGGSTLRFSTFVDDSSSSGDLKIDTAGNSYIAVQTPAIAPQKPASVVKIDATGSTALYSRQIDANGITAFLHLALDGGGNAMVSGATMSSDIAVPAPCFADSGGVPAARMYFLLRLNSSGETVDGGYLPLTKPFGNPMPFGLDSDGNLYAADYEAGLYAVRKFVPGPASGPVQLRCVAHGATLAKSPVAPGVILALFGDGIGPDQAANLQLDSSGKVATLLANTQVQFDGRPGPILYAQSRQINVVAPWELAGRSTTRICVLYQGQPTNCITVPVSRLSPGFFRSAPGAIAALNQDGSVNSQQNPARPGSIVTLFATGTGPAVPPEADGEVIQDIRRSALGIETWMFHLGGVMILTTVPFPVDVLFHGPAPALVSGVEVVQIRVPGDINSGNVALDEPSSTGVYADQAAIHIANQ